jgi:hypothetical protein
MSLPEWLQVVGVVTVAVGLGLAWVPLGVIAAGVGAVLVGMAWESD